MNRQSRSAGNQKRMWLPILLVAGAALLLVTAMASTEKETEKQFMPLNEAVEQALLQLENNSLTAASPEIIKEEVTKQQVAVEPMEKAANADEEIELASEKDDRIDINRAGMSELQNLKGIGPAKANAIIIDREKNGYFRSPDDLLRVKGIGNKLLSEIKESIVARP